MINISYSQFLGLVATASGPFSYRFYGTVYTCNPVVYLALHWPLDNMFGEGD